LIKYKKLNTILLQIVTKRCWLKRSKIIIDNGSKVEEKHRGSVVSGGLAHWPQSCAMLASIWECWSGSCPGRRAGPGSYNWLVQAAKAMLQKFQNGLTAS